MKTNILSSWKTSLFGVLAAAPQLAEAYTMHDYSKLLTGLGTLLLGLFSSEHKSTN